MIWLSKGKTYLKPIRQTYLEAKDSIYKANVVVYHKDDISVSLQKTSGNEVHGLFLLEDNIVGKQLGQLGGAAYTGVYATQSLDIAAKDIVKFRYPTIAGYQNWPAAPIGSQQQTTLESIDLASARPNERNDWIRVQRTSYVSEKFGKLKTVVINYDSSFNKESVTITIEAEEVSWWRQIMGYGKEEVITKKFWEPCTVQLRVKYDAVKHVEF